MRKLAVLVLCSLCTSFVLADANSAPATTGDKIGYTITSDFYSKYVWRGQLINDDYVFQPCISATYKGWTASIWGNVNTTDYGAVDNSGEFTEYDLTLDYSGKFSEESKIGYSVGVIHYHFPSIAEYDTTELYWGFNFAVPLNPTIKVYHGLGNENGTYVNLGISHTFDDIIKLTDKIKGDLVLGASLGWADGTYNKDYWANGDDPTKSVTHSGLNDLTFTAALPMELGGGWIFKPSLNYVTLVDSKIRDADTYSSSSDYFFTGLSVSKSF
jgi:hypothetical protein